MMEMALVKAELTITDPNSVDRDVHILISFPCEERDNKLFHKIIKSACVTLAYNLTWMASQCHRTLIDALYEEAIKRLPDDHDSDEYPEAIMYLANTLSAALEATLGKQYIITSPRHLPTFTQNMICTRAKSWVSTPFRPGFVESIDTE